MNKSNFNGAVFKDLRKAFDTISHSSIITKLPEYGIIGNEKELKNLLPNLNTSSLDSLRTVRKYRLPLIKTDRFKNSFILSQAAKVTL